MACKTVEKYERQVLALPKHSFKGGVHPLHDQHEGKTSTSGLPIREYIPDSVDIPMSMSIGAPAAPCVKVGDHVKLGQKIADATGFVSLPVHASVSGEVTAIGTKVLLLGGPTTIITIRNDFQDEWTELEPLGGGECLVTVMEGKYHQVKRMLAACGKPVTYLKRLSMGPLRLEDTLLPGQCRELSPEELAAVRSACML